MKTFCPLAVYWVLKDPVKKQLVWGADILLTQLRTLAGTTFDFAENVEVIPIPRKNNSKNRFLVQVSQVCIGGKMLEMALAREEESMPTLSAVKDLLNGKKQHQFTVIHVTPVK